MKANILRHAHKAVYRDRIKQYGHPSDNFGCIAALWSAYAARRGITTQEFTPRDVGLMMVLVKISREAQNASIDNLTDIAGYAAAIELLGKKRR